MELKENINEWTKHCEEVLHFLASHKSSGTKRDNQFLFQSFDRCKTLFEMDGKVDVIHNYGDKELCNSYPIKIIIQNSFNKQLHNNNDQKEEENKKKRWIEVYTMRIKRIYNKNAPNKLHKIPNLIRKYGELQQNENKIHKFYVKICNKYGLVPCQIYNGLSKPDDKENEEVFVDQSLLSNNNAININTSVLTTNSITTSSNNLLTMITDNDNNNNNDNNDVALSDDNNLSYLINLFDCSRFSRVRCRFVVPVIFLGNNSCIARSGTLSCTKELLLNKSIFTLSNNSTYSTRSSPIGTDLDILRDADIKLLNYLNIKYIFDLMVENHRNFGWSYCSTKISSSEKADKFQRYKSFYLNSIPYPGCDWFGKFKNAKYCKKIPKWNNSLHDAQLFLNNGNNKQNKYKQYKKYKKWDIILLTQNYLRIILDSLALNYIKKNNIGFLIHCVSGWDRTPLFISLIRLSLWADGIIHSTLNSVQILYLTLSYDWLLFTHQLGYRLQTGEDIFSFCFFMLQWITDQKYSMLYNHTNDDDDNQNQNTIRAVKLIEVYNLFNVVWSKVMSSDNPPKYSKKYD